jgi:integrase
MAVGRITKRSVEAIALPSIGKREFLWDDTLKGFGVMVTGNSVRSYVLQFRLGGRGHPTKRATIGQHGNPWTAERARERAADLLEDIRKGIDPVEAERQRADKRQQQRKSDTRLAFSTYADTFTSKHAEARGLRSADDIKAVFRRDLKPKFLNMPISSITRADVRDCLDEISERSPSAANKAHKWLRKLLAWAIDRGDLTSSPMAEMPAPHKDGERKRVLRGQELRLVWSAAEAIGHPFGTMVKLLLLTGQRLREVAGMKWEELDLAAAEWMIPGERTKNGHDHLCPLNTTAAAIINAIEPDAKKRKGHVLTTNGRTAISGFSKAKIALDNEIAGLIAKDAVWRGGEPEPLAPWMYHDLRRSLATGCQALGFPIEHVEALLNHVSGRRGGIVRIYQRHEYREEKARAVAAWGAHVAALVGDGLESSSVVAFRR